MRATGALRTDLEIRLDALRSRIAAAERRAGRGPGAVELVAITKGVAAERALALVALGQRDLGENRVDELERKAAAARAAGLDVRWHLVGHLQRNKVRRALRVAEVIHSVDSLALIEALGRIAAEEGRRPRVLLEVHLSGEPEKSGFAADGLRAALLAAGGQPHLRVEGLMTLAPRPDPRASDPHAGAARVFAELARLGRALEADPRTRAVLAEGRCRLSMGMSGDFERAIEAGADLVRVGSAIFADDRSTLGGGTSGPGEPLAPRAVAAEDLED